MLDLADHVIDHYAAQYWGKDDLLPDEPARRQRQAQLPQPD
jgi:hypothetical protein